MVELEKLGIPTVVVTTTEFEPLTRQSALSQNLPEARILVTNHPLGGTDSKTIIGWAEDSTEDLRRLFLM